MNTVAHYASTRAREGSRRVSRASIFKRFRYVVPPLVALRCNAGRGHEGRRLRGHSAIEFHCLRALQGRNCTQRVFLICFALLMVMSWCSSRFLFAFRPLTWANVRCPFCSACVGTLKARRLSPPAHSVTSDSICHCAVSHSITPFRAR